MPAAVLARLRARLHALPLRVRLILVVTSLLGLALVGTSVATALLMQRDLIGRVDAELRSAARPVATAAFNSSGRSDLPSGYAVIYLPEDAEPIQVTNPTGFDEHPAVPPLDYNDPRVTSHEPFTVPSIEGDGQWRVIAGRVLIGDQRSTYAVAIPLEGVRHTVRQLLAVTGLLGLFALITCAFIGWFLVRRAFRPLTDIEDTAAAIARSADDDLTRRVPMRPADDEVSSLARSLNAMLERIESSFAVREASEERMRQFVSDASHELRTPLATVRGYAELYRQGAVTAPSDVAGAMGRIEAEATRMGGLVDDLLTLARLDEEPHAAMADVDLTVLAADAVQDARARATDRQIELVPLGEHVRAVRVEGNEERLRQVLANLMANAIRHTPGGTPIEVAVGMSGDGSQGIVEVRDHGPGVPDEIARRIFERFYRADKARSRAGGGTGLGLAIVAAIVAGHGGRVGLAATPGGGATFVVQLPTANSQAGHTAL